MLSIGFLGGFLHICTVVLRRLKLQLKSDNILKTWVGVGCVAA